MKNLPVFFVCLGLTFALGAQTPSTFEPPRRKSIEIEVQHASELAHATLRGMRSVPKIITAAEFVGNTLSAYTAFRAAGKSVRFGGKALGKLSPVGPFLTAWFVLNAPLDIQEHNLNKRVAHAALDEAIAKADRLLSFNDGQIEIIYDGYHYQRREVIDYFRQLEADMIVADPTWDRNVVEALKAAVPIPFLFENNTAEREYRSASAQLLLAQAIRDLTDSVAARIIEKAITNEEAAVRLQYEQAGELAREHFFKGLSCSLYVTCHERDLPWDKHEAKHARQVTVPLPELVNAQYDTTGARRFSIMTDIGSISGRHDQPNYGCAGDELFGRNGDEKSLRDKNAERVFLWGREFALRRGLTPSSGEINYAIANACGEVTKWDGTFYLRTSTYQIGGVDPVRAAQLTPDGAWNFWMDFLMADPRLAEMMSRRVHDAPHFQEFRPRIQEPEMWAR